ncbi:SDR family NAD(P)-dependent oxidoreductase [Nevskia soli]|jgi:NAD(P)-dependent dehydrogenase (short-subunit alcohol dehydrogenase family)|uniref:SDR family NAD(P)-dependent oxidoreductase n=1 Tax=Nevskia soli TaxID=418856 RepID=UPI0015D70FBD|nr:SDR family oxidoreductase [Nevskia soli]
MRLEGKTAIITGAGAGIGEATAMRFAEEGAKLVLADLNLAGVEGVAERIVSQGGAAVAIAADISKEEDAKRISDTAVERFGAIDIVVNNAADFTTFSVEDATPQHWQRVLGVNVIGTAMVSKFAIPHIKARGRGSIVNIASMSGIIAQPNFATYNSSKGAVLTMTRCMAMDLAPFNIRVNSICPGCIYTTATEREWTRMGETKEQWSARQAPLHMLNRVGEAREVANAVLFLASDESSFITAAELLVDGGYCNK